MPAKTTQLSLTAAARLAAETDQRQQAEARHSQYPQYAGHWNGWTLMQITRRIAKRGTVFFDKGDLVLVSPERRTEKVAPRGGYVDYDLWPEREFVTAWSPRTGNNTLIYATEVREIASR